MNTIIKRTTYVDKTTKVMQYQLLSHAVITFILYYSNTIQNVHNSQIIFSFFFYHFDIVIQKRHLPKVCQICYFRLLDASIWVLVRKFKPKTNFLHSQISDFSFNIRKVQFTKLHRMPELL